MRLEVFHLGDRGARRFCVLHRPDGDCRGALLCVAPFAEELNKSRRMLSLGARTLAAAGWAALLLDPCGCGDSDGDFEDATWERWEDDVQAGAAWLATRFPGAPWLWGLRAGALLAMSAAHRFALAPRFLFWQPVTSGEQHLHQFLRIGSTQAALARGNAAMAGESLRERLRTGSTVEVAGYRISPALAAGMAQVRLDAPAPDRVAWLEVGTGEIAAMSIGGQQRLDAWRTAGVRAAGRVVAGEHFWQTAEIAECAALLDATTAVMNEVAA